jgi:hypothetical protein
MTQDGLLHADRPAEEGTATLDLLGRMIHAIGAHKTCAGPERELAEHWSDDML